ncbi:type VII secretion integral membrane protein EccD [Candidatus Mycobacterium methanotrophicum]|uniref:Type VII secretion integral membrane protein EccD n=1 Tax=Candidatus Mycobacterium methanotrophicum TaxID=2943498 RepID=A0ABY4QFZ2_9MYCO|nr:type VII secretion integral membrane protein EccD [Candidatus Mycobacterium methanotrophicum]UQX09920.1 type VII secretion integral membrane protein EccD [Candidatus Mycobacterium methanotrophicum]
MTAVAEAPQPGTEAVSSPQSVVLGIIAGEGAQIGVLLDANAPISVMIDPLLKVVNVRLRELGLPALEAKQRGRWALCLIDGTPLRAAQSLSEQDIYDGDRVWLRFIEDTEHRSQVIEHISTAVAVNLSKRFSSINSTVAIEVGASMVASGVLLGSALLGWFRWRHESWVPAPYAAVIAVLVISVALMILARSKTVQHRRAGDVLLWSGLAPLSVAAAAAPPGPVGAPHAVMGFAVAGVGAMMAVRFTGRRLGTGTAIVTVCLAATLASLARMAFGAGAVTLLTCILLACVFGYHGAPALSRWLSGIRLPVFPSATSRWVFEARPDLPTTVVHPAGGGRPTLEGPASVQDVVLRAERARAFLTGLLVGLGVLTIVSLAGVSDPRTADRWLPLLLAAATAGFLMLRGRSYVDRSQAITLALTSLVIIAAIVVRYSLVLSSTAAMSAGVAIVVLLPAAGLTAAAVVPNTIYSPLFRKLVEWVEYLCLMPIFPLALWLMNVYAAIRYR